MINEGWIRERILRGGSWRNSMVHAVPDHECQSANKCYSQWGGLR